MPKLKKGIILKWVVEMNKLQDDMIDIETIERIMNRTDRVALPEPKPRVDVWPWVCAAVIVGMVLYALSYDIATHVVQEMGCE